MNDWHEIEHLFKPDDGSLPDIYIENLSREEFIKIVKICLTYSASTKDIMAWNNESNKEESFSIDEFFHYYFRATLSTRPLHLDNIIINSTLLPQLNMFIYGPSNNGQENIIFDYRMGEKWNEKEVLSLLEFLSLLLDKTLNATIKRCPEGCYDQPDNEFNECLMNYYKQTRKSNAPL